MNNTITCIMRWRGTVTVRRRKALLILMILLGSILCLVLTSEAFTNSDVATTTSTTTAIRIRQQKEQHKWPNHISDEESTFQTRTIGRVISTRGKLSSTKEEIPDNSNSDNKKKSEKEQHLQSSSSSSTAATVQSVVPIMTQVDVIYGSRTSLVYDPKKEQFLPKSTIRRELSTKQLGNDNDNKNSNNVIGSMIMNSIPIQYIRKMIIYHIKPYMKAAFVPDGVTTSYYRYIKWRIFQRWINANLQVFGTQSLLLGLGIKTKSLAALSAALQWVLKDALGKIVRMIWASKMGNRFDSDAKRWRFRASLLFAAGNGMEIATYIFPQLFLLLATTANCCKQMSMLTSSATRNSLYNSFRDGTRENIGDITAKGEASIAIVDLLGIVTGVTASTILGTSIQSVLAVYFALQTIECFCIYRMMRTIQFKVLNFERLVDILQDYIDTTTNITETSSTINNNNNNNKRDYNSTIINGEMKGRHQQQQQSAIIKTPAEMAQTEMILKPPSDLSRRSFAFGSLGRAKLQPDELLKLLEIFQNDKFLLVVGKNMKASRNPFVNFVRRIKGKDDPSLKIQENCHIVLHLEATNFDVVKSTLALMLLRQKMSQLRVDDPDQIRSRDCFDLILESKLQADKMLPRLLRLLGQKGWTSPARFMFGQVHMRAEWPLMRKVS